MRRFSPIIALLCCVAVLGIAACGSSKSSSSPSASTPSATATTRSTSLATTKFALHAGLGFGAFHHFIYRPIRAGALTHPTAHKAALLKAGLASLFVYHELKLAAADAQSSKILHPLVAPLTAAADKLKSLKSGVTNGTANGSEIDGLNSQLAGIKGSAAAKGQPINEMVPSSSQLAAGASGTS